MKRFFWLALVAIPVLALGVVGDVAAGQVDGVNGEGGRPFTTILLGANEVPAAPNSDLVGTARVTINLGQSELCWDLDYTTTQHVVAAHIHKGPSGAARPVVFGFFNPPASTVVVNSGCRSGDRALLAAIAADPGAYYVNVHTSLYPTGAGRGQLTK
ncbi:MAG TPA: CHRD domain-containing protein [Candidatus Dormibacteraeota bacterium]